jgi:hypothetical protein
MLIWISIIQFNQFNWFIGYVTPLLQHLENHISKRNKRNRPERKLEAQEKGAALDISLYVYKINANSLHNRLNSKFSCRDVNPCLEKRCVIYYALWRLLCTCLELNFYYSKIVTPYLPQCYNRTKNKCHRTRRKASNINMIQTFFGLLSTWSKTTWWRELHRLKN